ncbi:MAG TPA: WD40 repeat domain-containing protein [Gemmataceae bacterium]|nr:WD40 repeat domain-containing protein [Gemmataceae bacterium]
MLTLAGHTAAVRCVANSPDGTRLASGGDDSTLRVWDLSKRKEARTWLKLSPSVEAVTFTPDGALVIAGLGDGRLMALTPNRRYPRWEWPAHAGGVRAVVAHPDGERVYTTGWDRDVCVWQLSNPQRQWFPGVTDHPLSAMALSANGGWLAVGLSHTYKVQLINSHTAKPSHSLTSDDGAVYSLAFSADSSLLAPGDTRGRVLLWPVADPNRPRALKGHNSIVYGLAFTPDGRQLVTAGADRTARVWDVATGRQMQVYEWHQRWVTCLAMSPDGLTVATGGDDQVVAVWDIGE